MQPVQVTLVSGFFGAGMTSLLTHVLEAPRNTTHRRVVLISAWGGTMCA
jgi:G3E family GTPase